MTDEMCLRWRVHHALRCRKSLSMDELADCLVGVPRETVEQTAETMRQAGKVALREGVWTLP